MLTSVTLVGVSHETSQSRGRACPGSVVSGGASPVLGHQWVPWGPCCGDPATLSGITGTAEQQVRNGCSLCPAVLCWGTQAQGDALTPVGPARPAVPAHLPFPAHGGAGREEFGAALWCRHPSPSAPGTIHLPLPLAAGHPLSQARQGSSQGLARREGTAGTAWGTCCSSWPCSGH